MTIGERIKKRRIELGMSVDDLASSIGKNRATVYRYERNDIEKLPTTVLEPLAKALKTTPSALMGIDDDSDYEHSGYYTNPKTAVEAQKMYDDPVMRHLYDMKRTMDPDKFQAHVDLMDTLYKQEHPEYDEGC